MSDSHKVTVRICDMPYTITTDEPESYLQELAVQVDSRMRQMMAGNPRVSTNMAAVLSAVTLADEAHKAEEAADNLRVKLRDYLEENDALRQELQRLRASEKTSMTKDPDRLAESPDKQTDNDPDTLKGSQTTNRRKR